MKPLLCGLLFLIAMLPAFTQFIDVTQTRGLGNYFATSGHHDSAGGIFADLNNDRYPDLALISDGGRKLHLYLNIPAGVGGERRFASPVILDTGMLIGRAVGVVAADYDNDGDLDIYVVFHKEHFYKDEYDYCLYTNLCSPNMLYGNESQGNQLIFNNVTAATYCGVSSSQNAGVGHGEWPDKGGEQRIPGPIILDNSLTATWADVNRDGYVDLYVGNHVGDAQNPETGLGLTFDFFGQPDLLLLSEGFCDNPFIPTPVFKNVSFERNTPGYHGVGARAFEPQKTGGPPIQFFSSTVAAMFTDLNDDLWPDLIVMNKAGGPADSDTFYINKGLNEVGEWDGFSNATGQFTPPPLVTSFGTISSGARGVDVGDFDLDGDMDIYIGDFETPQPSQPNDFFANLWNQTGPLDFQLDPNYGGTNTWGVRWFDANLDGRLDLFVGADLGRTNQLYVQNILGNFTNQAALFGVDNDLDTRSVLKADYDLDGDLDLFVINLNEEGARVLNSSVLWENQASQTKGGNRFLDIKLKGDPDLAAAPFKSSKDALGAKVRVTASLDGSLLQTQSNQVLSGGGHGASSSSMALNFGMGIATQADIEILWPSGRIYQLTQVPTNQFLEIEEQANNQVWSVTEGFQGLGPLNNPLNHDSIVNWNASNLQLSDGKAIPQGLAHPTGYRLMADILVEHQGSENTSYTYAIETVVTLKQSGLFHLGFGETSLQAMELGNRNLFFELARNGKLRLMQNGTTKIAGPFQMEDLFLNNWDIGDPVFLRMVYDSYRKQVRIYAGLNSSETRLLAESISLAAGQSDPIITYCGFQARRAQPHATPAQIFATHKVTVDDFSITITDNVAPQGSVTVYQP